MPYETAAQVTSAAQAILDNLPTADNKAGWKAHGASPSMAKAKAARTKAIRELNRRVRTGRPTKNSPSELRDTIVSATAHWNNMCAQRIAGFYKEFHDMYPDEYAGPDQVGP